MSAFYRKYQSKTPGKTQGKWYGRAVVMNNISTENLASEISHSTTVTYADILAVLAELTVAMQRHLANSERVVLDGIGSFKIGLRSSPADKKEDFTANNISGFHVIYSPERIFHKTGLNEKGHATGFYENKMAGNITLKDIETQEKTSGKSDDKTAQPA